MDIFKIVGIGITAAVLIQLLKKEKPELAVQISLLTAAFIFLKSVPNIRSVIGMFDNIAARMGISTQYITLVLKVIGIAYAGQFGAELCRDAGESSVASGIELAGKVLIMTLSMPMVYSLLETVEQIMRSG